MRDYKNLVVSEGVKKVETLHVEYKSPYDEHEIPDDVIRSEFAQQIAKNILEENYMIITKDQDLFRRQIVYHGRITLAPVNMGAIISDDYHYETQGMSFSTDEINKAIRNTWPEKFL